MILKIISDLKNTKKKNKKMEFIQGKSAVGKPAALAPVRIEMEKGKSYSWCACGLSKKQVKFKNLISFFLFILVFLSLDKILLKFHVFSFRQPFCDGSHKTANASLKEGQDKFGPLRFVCEESRTVMLCMCKSSSNRPFCDGTHEQLKAKK
jgi:CDGSH-type Zn-finger protein